MPGAAIALLGAAFALLNYAFDEIGNPALRPVRARRIAGAVPSGGSEAGLESCPPEVQPGLTVEVRGNRLTRRHR